MVARVHTVAYAGIEVVPVEVQVSLAGGLARFNIVGLPDKAVGESRERVRAALAAMALALPPKRITVNLAPASLAKEGSHFDLPIAVGLLVALGIIPEEEIASYTVLGELGLDGSIAAVPGVLPAALAAAAAERGIVCPAANGPEAPWAGPIDVVAAPHLLSIINHFKGTHVLPAPTRRLAPAPPAYPDLRDIRGQETAKRALEIAAAGGHHLLMCGPPGAGKSMLAQRLPGILPPLDAAETLEVSMVQSVAGVLKDGTLARTRPFRDPHHSASLPALVGGGARAKPGEITLAHRGVLFLDELPEFQRAVLDSLRQPLETGTVTIARANAHVTYPADFQLIGAMNPCRCGHLGDPARSCSRAPACAADYQARLSGPMLDRIDLHIEVPPVPAADLALAPAGEASALVAARVAEARARQAERARREGAPPRVRTNAQADGELLARIAAPDADGRALLAQAAEWLGLSARGYHRVLRVARTIADLEGADAVRRVHIAEALGYRRAVVIGQR